MTQIRNIYQKINAIMGKVKYARKEAKNQGLKYSYVSHDAVVGLLRDVVQEEGVVILPSIESYGMVNSMLMMQLKVSIINIDNPDDQIIMNFSVPSNSRNGVVDEKTFGSTYSYAFKYALLKTFMIETGEDADAHEEPKDSKKMSDSRLSHLRSLELINPEHMKKCLNALKITKIEDIPVEMYDRIVKSFLEKKEEKAA